MAQEQRKYEKEYKVQAVKLAKETGAGKAAKELGIPVDTLYGWQKAVREGRLDAGPGSRDPVEAMSLAEELGTLRKQIKALERENQRLKEENEFLAEARAFFAASIGSQQGTANEICCAEDGLRRKERKNRPVLSGSEGEPAGFLPVSLP